MKLTQQLLLSFALTFVYLCLLAKSTLAESSSLSLNPATVELLLSPNKKITQAFTLTNQGERGNFVANLHTFVPADQEGHITLSPRPLVLEDITLMVRLENADLSLGTPFTLAQGESRQLVLSLEAPSGSVTSDIYLSLVITTLPAKGLPSASSTSATAGLGALIMTTITPDGILPIKLEVEDLSVPAIHDSALPLALSPVLANHGPAMLRYSGDLTITGPQGQKSLELPLYNNIVLKDSKRLIMGTNQAGDSLPLTWQPSIWDIGLYSVQLTVRTQGGTTIQEVERSVWVLPLRLTAITLIAITSLLLLIYLRSRRLQKSSKLPLNPLDTV